MIDLSHLPKCGPKRIEALQASGFFNTQDIISHIPRKYEDRRFVTPFEEWEDSKLVVCGGVVSYIETHSHPKERLIIGLDVHEGPIVELVFFGKIGGFIAKKFTEGKLITAIGNIQTSRGHQMVHPEILAKSIHSYQGSYLPIYSLSEKIKDSGVSQKLWGSWVDYILKTKSFQNSDPLDLKYKEYFQLADFANSLQLVHKPKNPEDVRSGLKSLKYRELIPIVEDWVNRQKDQALVGSSTAIDLVEVSNIQSSLGFELTSAQESTLKALFQGVSRNSQFTGLLQADVGAGKTIIAALCSIAVAQKGGQVSVMAPTEVLARQLHQVFLDLAAPTIEVSYLSGSVKGKERELVLENLAEGKIKILIGTHALFQKAVEFQNLRLVVIDEQHRFGVNQRLSLLEKGNYPDLLMMTATPIPRSLLQTFYGDLEVLTMKGMPKGRIPSKTALVPSHKKVGMIRYLNDYLNEGGRIYWVLPRIESEELASVESTSTTLGAYFQGVKVQKLHGRMSDDEKLTTLDSFRSGQTQVLVATTVIEVGVNVPEANIIVIENAEQFGLSQLHQLRGRVGRGGSESWCFLLSENEDAQERLNQFSQTHDGFEIAELDLAQRGAGDLNGYMQSGWSNLKFVDYLKDMKFIQSTIEIVRSFT